VICGNGHNPWALALTTRLERPRLPDLLPALPSRHLTSRLQVVDG
jgi:hypothetical protein